MDFILFYFESCLIVCRIEIRHEGLTLVFSVLSLRC